MRYIYSQLDWSVRLVRDEDVRNTPSKGIKVYSFGNRNFEDEKLLLRNNILLTFIEVRKHVSNEIVFVRDEVGAWIVLINIDEPASYTIKCGVFVVMKVVSVNVQLSTDKHGKQFCENHNNGEKFLVLNGMF